MPMPNAPATTEPGRSTAARVLPEGRATAPLSAEDRAAVIEARFAAHRLASPTLERRFRLDSLGEDRSSLAQWSLALGLTYGAFVIVDPLQAPGVDQPWFRLALRLAGLVMGLISTFAVRRVSSRRGIDVASAVVYLSMYVLFAVSEHHFPSHTDEGFAFHALMLIALFMLFPMRLDWSLVLAFAVSVGFVSHFARPPFTSMTVSAMIPPMVIAVVFGVLSSIRIRRARRREWLSRVLLTDVLREKEALAQTDPLTGALNRRGFLARAELALGRPRHDGQSSGVLLFDLDHFKRVNDTSGHEAGDRVLRDVIGVANAHLRPHDLLGRWGGEEFVVLLPGADPDTTRQVAERVRQAVGASVSSGDCAPINVTVSVGATTVAGPELVNHAVDRADAAMYEAKRAGRDRVVFRPGPVYDSQIEAPP